MRSFNGEAILISKNNTKGIIVRGYFKNDLKDILSKKIQGPVCILVGPEGDFSEKERQLIVDYQNTISFSLAKNILRAETAAIAATTILSYNLNFK